MLKWLFSALFLAAPTASWALPQGFVYLKSVDPSIAQDMRYTTDHNFVGKPLNGYNASECILTREAATQLSKVQQELLASNLSLKVYDCYRPQRAVDDFLAWSTGTDDGLAAEFAPHMKKSDVFKLGYVAKKSGHTRGSTVDLTIVPVPTLAERRFIPGEKLVACTAPYQQRFQDNGIDMGTGYDCLDEAAHPDYKKIDTVAYYNRQMFSALMEKYHFKPLSTEWWHFTLRDEPFPDTYFDFTIEALAPSKQGVHQE